MRGPLSRGIMTKKQKVSRLAMNPGKLVLVVV